MSPDIRAEKKTLLFELEGVLANILSQEEALQIHQDQLNASGDNSSGCNQNLSGVGPPNKKIVHIQTQTISDNNIITNQDYYVQFRPYLMHMLRALKPFYELIIFTDKTKEEAETITNEIEKD